MQMRTCARGSARIASTIWPERGFVRCLPSFINEFRYGWSNRMHINQATGFGSGANGALGLKGVDR